MRRFILPLLLISILCFSCKPKQDTKQTGDEMRIVSLSPNITELLFALGLDDNICGVTTYCNYPARAELKPKVGSIMEPDIETILAMRPTLVLATGTTLQQQFMERIEGIGTKGQALRAGTIAEIYSSLETIGQLTGTEAKAAEIKEEIKVGLAEITKTTEGKPRPTVMIVIQREPLMVAGKGTYIDSLLSIAGGDNVCKDNGYPQYNAEALVMMNPDIIIETDFCDNFTKNPATVAHYSVWDSTTAAKEENIYSANADLLSRPGPRIVSATNLISQIIEQCRKPQIAEN